MSNIHPRWLRGVAADRTGCSAAIRRPAWWLSVVWQLVTVLLISALLMLADSVWAYSALLGGLIAVIPNAYFARQVFRYSGAGSTRAVMQSFYRGEAGKFITTALLFAGVFALVKPLVLTAVLVMYIAMLLLNSMLAGWLLKRVSRSG